MAHIKWLKYAGIHRKQKCGKQCLIAIPKKMYCKIVEEYYAQGDNQSVKKFHGPIYRWTSLMQNA